MRVNDTSVSVDLGVGTTVGDAFSLAHLEGYAIVFTLPPGSTVAGTVKLSASNNAVIDNPGVNVILDPAAVWVDVPGSSNAVASGANSYLWNTSSAYYKWVRWSFTGTSGAGTALIISHAKGPQS